LIISLRDGSDGRVLERGNYFYVSHQGALFSQSHPKSANDMTSFGKVLILSADTAYSNGKKDVRAAENTSQALLLSLEYAAQNFDAQFLRLRLVALSICALAH